MAFPDWIEGKQQYTSVVNLFYDDSLSTVAAHPLVLYDGSGEVIAGSIEVQANPHVINDNDYLNMYLDGSLLTAISWRDACSRGLDNWKRPVVPTYYDGVNFGLFLIEKPTAFLENIGWSYTKHNADTQRVILNVVVGIY